MPAITCHQVQHPVAEDVFGEIANEEREVDMVKEGLIKMFAFDVSRAAPFSLGISCSISSLYLGPTHVHIRLYGSLATLMSYVTPPIPSSFDSENNFSNPFL